MYGPCIISPLPPPSCIRLKLPIWVFIVMYCMQYMVQNDLELSPIPFTVLWIIMSNVVLYYSFKLRRIFSNGIYNICIIYLSLKDYAVRYLALSILTVLCWFTYFFKDTFCTLITKPLVQLLSLLRVNLNYSLLRPHKENYFSHVWFFRWYLSMWN